MGTTAYIMTRDQKMENNRDRYSEVIFHKYSDLKGSIFPVLCSSLTQLGLGWNKGGICARYIVYGVPNSSVIKVNKFLLN